MDRDSYQHIEDFLQDVSFTKWVQKGIDDANWAAWMKEMPANYEVAKDAQLVLLAIGIEEPTVPSQEISASLKQTWNKIEALQTQSASANVSFFKIRWQVAAAVVLLGIGLGWYFLQPRFTEIIPTEITTRENLLKRINTTNNPILIALEDGSSVLLQPGSELNYPKVFPPNERIVSLTGEAFFEISKNPARPFSVYANEIVTKVIGTSFRIKAYKNQPNVEVTVRTGQVKVSRIKTNSVGLDKEISLHPNESILFVRNHDVFEKPVIANKNYTGQIEQFQFDFTDTPVSKILETIEVAYQVKIKYPKEALRECYLSTSLTDEPLPEKLKIICESLGNQSHYELHENQIVIFSTGCN